MSQVKATPNLRRLRGDILDPKRLRRAFSEGVDVVVHLAAIPNAARCDSQPERAAETNISGTDLVLREASRHNCLFIFASSQTVYGGSGKLPANETMSPNPRDLYSLTKMAGENMVRSYHRAGLVRGVILRISSVYGAGAWANLEQIPGRMVADVIAKRAISLISSTNLRRPGGQIVDLIHVRDACDAIAEAVRKDERVEGEILNISSGTGVPVIEVARLVAKVARETRAIEDVRFLHAFRSTDLIPRLVLSNAKARSVLGWKPKIQLRQGIEELFKNVEATRMD